MQTFLNIMSIAGIVVLAIFAIGLTIISYKYKDFE